MGDKKKRSWFVRLLRAAGCLCVLVVIGAWAVKIWVLPPLVRGEARAYLDDVWFGTLDIDDVEVNIFSPSYVRGVTLRDDLGRTWLEVPEVRVNVVWDGYVPRLASVRVATAKLIPQFASGECTVPLKPVEPSDDPVDIVTIVNDFQGIELTIGVVSLHTANDVLPSARKPEGVALPTALARAISRTDIIFPGVEWKGGTLSFAKAIGDIGTNRVSANLSGGLQPDRSMAIRGEGLLLAADEAIKGTFDVRFMPGGGARLEVGFTGEVQADLIADVQSDGTAKATLDVLASNIQPDEFKWLIGSNEMVWLAVESSTVKAHIEATIQADMSAASTGRIDLSGPIGEISAVIKKGQYAHGRAVDIDADITGTLCGGKLADTSVKVTRDRGEDPAKLVLNASVENVKMADLTGILAPDKIMEAGVGKGMIHIEMSGSDLASIEGRGAFFLNDANLWNAPILSALFRHMKLKFDKADLQARFTLDGMTAKMTTGQFATMLWAAEFEPGGTIDYDSGVVDMYVLFLPVKQAGILLNIVEAINPLKLLAKQVFRLHVTGTRDAPVIIPVPFSDLAKLPAGALGLLKSVTASGGQLGGDIFKAILNGGN